MVNKQSTIIWLTPTLPWYVFWVLLRALPEPWTYGLMSNPKDKVIMVKCLAEWHKCQDRDLNPHSADQKHQSLLPLTPMPLKTIYTDAQNKPVLLQWQISGKCLVFLNYKTFHLKYEEMLLLESYLSPIFWWWLSLSWCFSKSPIVVIPSSTNFLAAAGLEYNNKVKIWGLKVRSYMTPKRNCVFC